MARLTNRVAVLLAVAAFVTSTADLQEHAYRCLLDGHIRADPCCDDAEPVTGRWVGPDQEPCCELVEGQEIAFVSGESVGTTQLEPPSASIAVLDARRDDKAGHRATFRPDATGPPSAGTSLFLLHQSLLI